MINDFLPWRRCGSLRTLNLLPLISSTVHSPTSGFRSSSCRDFADEDRHHRLRQYRQHGGDVVGEGRTSGDVFFAQSRQSETTRRRAWAACSRWHGGGGFSVWRRRLCRRALRRHAATWKRLRERVFRQDRHRCRQRRGGAGRRDWQSSAGSRRCSDIGEIVGRRPHRAGVQYDQLPPPRQSFQPSRGANREFPWPATIKKR